MQRLRALGRTLITADAALGTTIWLDIILISVEQYAAATQILLIVRTIGIGQQLVVEAAIIRTQDCGNIHPIGAGHTVEAVGAVDTCIVTVLLGGTMQKINVSALRTEYDVCAKIF